MPVRIWPGAQKFKSYDTEDKELLLKDLYGNQGTREKAS